MTGTKSPYGVGRFATSTADVGTPQPSKPPTKRVSIAVSHVEPDSDTEDNSQGVDGAGLGDASLALDANPRDTSSASDTRGITVTRDTRDTKSRVAALLRTTGTGSYAGSYSASGSDSREPGGTRGS